MIFTLNPETQKREVVGEWHFNDTDLSLCKVEVSILFMLPLENMLRD